MANTISKVFLSHFLASALFISAVLGGGIITCEELDRSTCAFAVSSSGLRCVLEKHVHEGGLKEDYSCRNSGVEAAACVAGSIETDRCISSCGLDRDMVGISSDLLLDRRFIQHLCSSDCYDSCHNVVDHFTIVAAGEGVSLSNLCEVVKSNRREMEEMNKMGGRKLGGWDAQSPVGGDKTLGGWDAQSPVVGGMRLGGWDAPSPVGGGRKLDVWDAPSPTGDKRKLDGWDASPPKTDEKVPDGRH